MELDHSAVSLGDQTVTVTNRVSCEGKTKEGSHPDERVLTELERSNHFLAETTSDLVSIATVSEQPTYVYLNPSHKRVFGHEPFEMLGKNPLDFIHPEDREGFLNFLKRHFLSRTKGTASKEGQDSPQKVLYRIKDQSGDYHHLETTVDRLGEGYLLLVSKDTTEDIRIRERLLEDNESLKQRLEDQNEEMATSKKVLKEEIFKRWRAEEAFRESEEQNKALLESFEDGYFEVDLAGNLTFFNESLCKMVGYSHQEMMGMNNRQYMTPETSKKVYETFNEVFRTGKATKAFDWELLRKNGQVRHVETSVSPVYGTGGDKIGFRGIARDVTERWMAEQACRESEEKYRDIIESIEDGYYEVDLKGNLVFFNEALKKILGYSSDEMMGMNNRQYMSEKTAKIVYETFNEVYRSGKPTKAVDWELIRKDGEKRYLETSVSSVRDSSGHPIGFRGIGRDVTERRLARKALEESEQKYRTILQSIEDGYYEVDLQGNMIFSNDSMCRILGYSQQELKGMNNRNYMSEETSKKVFQTFNQVYLTGEPAKAFGWELIRKDGQRRYVENSVSLIRSHGEQPIGFRGIARDITELKALEKARERVINHLSHELGTPLSIIESVFVRMSKETEKEGKTKTREWIERGERNVRRLKDLQKKIDDILNHKPIKEKEGIIHLIEASLVLLEELKDAPLKESAASLLQSIMARLNSVYGMEVTRKERISISSFLNELCDEAIHGMIGRQIEIVREFESEVYIEMDPTVLRKALGGLLRNAIENTPDEGRIEIRASKQNKHVTIDVQDFGVGITSLNQKMIFGGFFHTQDTSRYASKKPYAFNAGGAGADLLRTKVFSERFGFTVNFSSTRCKHLPSDTDECPGKVSSCSFINSSADCLSSGGSTFSLHLPISIFSEM